MTPAQIKNYWIKKGNLTKEEGKELQDQVEKAMKRKKEPTTLHSKLKEIFEEKYKEFRNDDYYWTGKDAGQLTGVIKKIKFKIEKRQGKQAVNDENVIFGWEVILDSYPKMDKWIQDNFTISTINSKFNEIFTNLKNGNKTQNYKSEISKRVGG